MINKKINVLLLGILILFILPLVYSGSYGTGVYDTNNYSITENSTIISPISGSSGGGGGGSSGGGGGSSINSTNITHRCLLDSDCNKSQYCFENICHDAECTNDSVCDINTGETCWDYRCVKLFDVTIQNFTSPVELGEFFKFTYLIKGMANINDDVKINFWIEKNKKVLTSGHDTVYVKSFEKKIETTKLFLPTDIDSGDYTFFVQLNYGTYKANSHRTIELIPKKGTAPVGISSKTLKYIILGSIVFSVIILFLLFYSERRKVEKATTSEVKWAKKYKKTLLTSFLFAISGALIYHFRWYKVIISWILKGISGVVRILVYLIPYRYYIFGTIFLLVLFVIVARKKKLFNKLHKFGEQ